MNCDVCGEFDCEIDHDEEDERDDDSWMFDGSGMVGD
jgi:hypothetical protein